MADDPFAGTFKEEVDPPKAKTNSGGDGQNSGPTTGGAGEQQPEAYTGPITLDDFIAYLPQHTYFFTPTREQWSAGGINARFGLVLLVDEDGKPLLDDKGKPMKVPASDWLDQRRAVEQMTWLPGEPMLIKDRLITLDGPIERAGVTTFNLYRPPMLIHRRGNIALWRDHLYRIYPDEAEHMEKWLAQRVQRPQVKINHALVLGGEPGIGKDSMLEPVKRAVGRSNVHEVSPLQILGPFNGFVRAVLLRVNEARDLGEYDRFKFYDHMKGIIAAPPDVLRVNEKHLREYYVINVVGVVYTTNYKSDGMFLAPGDRRHLVGWSECKEKDFDTEHWNKLWHYYDHGGDAQVAAHLAELDISTFDPKASPPKTAAYWEIVSANRSPEDAELADVLDRLGKPNAVTLIQVRNEAVTMGDGFNNFVAFLSDEKKRRQIPHRFERCGYARVNNDNADDGLWVINRKRQNIYARSELNLSERIKEALELQRGSKGAFE
jgi:hypothetical protein